MKKEEIFYQDRRKKYINVNMKYENILKMHNIKTKKENIASILISLKNILYVLDKKGNILEEIKAVQK